MELKELRQKHRAEGQERREKEVVREGREREARAKLAGEEEDLRRRVELLREGQLR